MASASGDIREGLADLAEGTAELDDGLIELAEGTREFAEGMSEFSEGVAEGAADLREGAGTMPSDEALEVLNNPVVFDGSNIAGATPLGWTTDALIASLAGGEISRVIAALISLVVVTVVAYILSALILRSKRTLATQTQVGLQA